MSAMTEKQVINAWTLLSMLYAEKMGFRNPVVTVKRKGEFDDEIRITEEGSCTGATAGQAI